MSTVLQPQVPRRFSVSDSVWNWLPIALGLAVLYLPTFYELNHTLWDQEDNVHGPIILMVVLWLFWHKRVELFAVEARPATVAGSVCLAFGLLTYVLGRSQSIILLETGSIIPVLSGLLLFLKGWRALRIAAFPVLFVFFMLPLPGLVTEPLTGPLRHYISVLAENILYAAGYPIARSGVILNVGQYQLLVAEACSGINSIFSLSALGLLYLYLMKYKDWRRNGILLASIVPIAFTANLFRVMLLVLVTYHFGDAAGQGFVHEFAGMVLFILALLMIFAVDALAGATLFKVKSQ